MRIQGLVCLALLHVAGAMAQSSSFRLGVNYSEWLSSSASQMATDSSGAIYFLSSGSSPCVYCVTKLSADGSTILWQNRLGFEPTTMAVDPNGGVYVIPATGPAGGPIYVDKVNASASGLTWQAPAGFLAGTATPNVLAGDSQGCAYVGLSNTAGSSFVVRLNAAGTAVDYTAPLTGTVTAIAVDPSGAAFVAGTNAAVGFLERLTPNGEAGFRTALPQDSSPSAVALDTNGDAVVVGGGVVQRVDSTGTVTITSSVPGGWSLTLDAAGNAYVAGTSDQLLPVKNNLATCGWISSDTAPAAAGWLTVVAPDGAILQTTYIPGSVGSLIEEPIVATGMNSTVLVTALAGMTFAPTQTGPPVSPDFTGFGWSFLMSFFPNANARTVSLACVGNSASFEADAVAPGEVVTLFGNGLGPQQGVQPQATLQSPYPTQAGSVQVTFDGTPAPLLWVQDSQINAVAPWSLAPGVNTEICVTYNNATTNCLTWPVVEADPAVYTVDGVYAAAVNQDGTMNSASNPAPVGSIVAVWATGLGPIAPAQPDGTLVGLPLPSNVLAAGVQAQWSIQESAGFGFSGLLGVGTQPFTVTYLGPAPYLAAGISQINIQAAQYPITTDRAVLVVTLPAAQSAGFQIYVAGQ